MAYAQYNNGYLTPEQIEQEQRQKALAAVLKEMGLHMQSLVTSLEIMLRSGLDPDLRERIEEHAAEFGDRFKWLMQQVPERQKVITRR